MILTMVSLDALLIADTSDAMEGLLPTMYCCCLIFMSFSTLPETREGDLECDPIPVVLTHYLFQV